MLWIGLRSMQIDASRPSGALYRVGVDGASDRKEFGLVVANGLGWSPDGRTFYLVDTIPGLIYAYDSDPASGVLSSRRIFVDLSRICAAPSARLSHFPFEGDRALPTQC